MNLEIIDAKIKERLEPHLKALVEGVATEYDILPTVLLTLFNNQNSLLQSQTELGDFTHSQLDKLAVSQQINSKSLLEIFNAINGLKIKQGEFENVQFVELKGSHEQKFQEVLKLIGSNNNAVDELLKNKKVLEDTLLNNQNSLLQSQTEFGDFTHSQLDKLAASQEANGNSLFEISKLVSELKGSHEQKFQEFLKLIDNNNNSIDELLKNIKGLEGTLLKTQTELVVIKRFSVIGLILSLTSIVMLGGVIFLILK